MDIYGLTTTQCNLKISYKITNVPTLRSNNSTSNNFRTFSHRLNIYKAAIFIIAKDWKYIKCPSMGK